MSFRYQYEGEIYRLQLTPNRVGWASLEVTRTPDLASVVIPVHIPLSLADDQPKLRSYLKLKVRQHIDEGGKFYHG